MSSSMYSLKPIIKNCEIEAPNCMYKLKNIYGEKNSSSDSSAVSLNILDISEQIKKFLKKVPNFIFWKNRFFFLCKLTKIIKI